MKNSIQAHIVKTIGKEVLISPTGKGLIITAMIIQIPFMWLPFATQIVTCILLGIALSHMNTR